MMKIEEVIGLSDDMAKAWMPCLYLSMRHEIFGYPKEVNAKYLQSEI